MTRRHLELVRVYAEPRKQDAARAALAFLVAFADTAVSFRRCVEELRREVDRLTDPRRGDS